jgi:hypothetical protein
VQPILFYWISVSVFYLPSPLWTVSPNPPSFLAHGDNPLQCRNMISVVIIFLIWGLIEEIILPLADQLHLAIWLQDFAWRLQSVS